MSATRAEALQGKCFAVDRDTDVAIKIAQVGPETQLIAGPVKPHAPSPS